MICSALILIAITFPSYFDSEQQTNTVLILKKAKEIGEDPYYLIATAWVHTLVIMGSFRLTGVSGQESGATLVRRSS